MKLYLDDNVADPLLARLLQKAGHDVLLPRNVGFVGKDDAVHLTFAVLQGRVCLSANYGHFENLHGLVLAVKGHHPGILIVRRDNDRKRDLFQSGIVRAIQNLVKAGVPIADEYIILNHWR